MDAGTKSKLKVKAIKVHLASAWLVYIPSQLTLYIVVCVILPLLLFLVPLPLLQLILTGCMSAYLPVSRVVFQVFACDCAMASAAQVPFVPPRQCSSSSSSTTTTSLTTLATPTTHAPMAESNWRHQSCDC